MVVEIAGTDTECGGDVVGGDMTGTLLVEETESGIDDAITGAHANSFHWDRIVATNSRDTI